MARKHRSASNAFYLFNRLTTLGWSIARHIGSNKGEALVDAGKARRVYNGFGVHVGYQLVESTPSDHALPSLQTATTITIAELHAAIGAFGKSRTVGMNEDDRLTRVHRETGRVLPAEDFVERSMEKLRWYPLIQDRKAPLGGRPHVLLPA